MNGIYILLDPCLLAFARWLHCYIFHSYELFTKSSELNYLYQATSYIVHVAQTGRSQLCAALNALNVISSLFRVICNVSFCIFPVNVNQTVADVALLSMNT